MSKPGNAFETVVPRSTPGLCALVLKKGQAISQNGRVQSNIAPRIFQGTRFDIPTESRHEARDRFRRIRGSSQ